MSDLHLTLDRTHGRLAIQIAAELRRAIREGRLPTGTRLPSTRTLAADLSVARGVIVSAYEQLVAEGFLLSRTGSGTHVAPAAGNGTVHSRTESRQHLEPPAPGGATALGRAESVEPAAAGGAAVRGRAQSRRGGERFGVGGGLVVRAGEVVG
ncbi:GntR family transcriptional regulator, partial [Actinocorallia lasiicapitis]